LTTRLRVAENLPMPTTSSNKRVFLLVLGFIAFALIAHSAYRSLSAQKVQQDTLASIVVSDPPGDLELEKLDGGKATIAHHNGSVLIINFWAGWCAPCIREMPGLFDFYNRLEKKGLTVMAMNMDEDVKQGLDLLTKRVGLAPFPFYKGTGSKLANQFEIVGLPYTVVVGRDGRVLYSKAGEVDWKNSEVTNLIERIL
jgi:thiol-disulfide isomerase/thioredoxin